MRFDFQRFAILSGLLGTLVMAVCLASPALVYHGKNGEGFSFLNHFMSELGLYRLSPWAVVYNSGLFIGGGLLLVSILGVGWQYRTRLGVAATVCGVLAGVSCSLLGFFPLNRLVVHLSLAYTFFVSWPVTVGLFCLLPSRQARSRLTRPLLVLGGISFLLFIVFLALPFLYGLHRLWAVDLRTYVRPAFLFPALLEWLMVSSVLVWIALACVDLLHHKRLST